MKTIDETNEVSIAHRRNTRLADLKFRLVIKRFRKFGDRRNDWKSRRFESAKNLKISKFWNYEHLWTWLFRSLRQRMPRNLKITEVWKCEDWKLWNLKVWNFETTNTREPKRCDVWNSENFEDRWKLENSKVKPNNSWKFENLRIC